MGIKILNLICHFILTVGPIFIKASVDAEINEETNMNQRKSGKGNSCLGLVLCSSFFLNGFLGDIVK